MRETLRSWFRRNMPETRQSVRNLRTTETDRVIAEKMREKKEQEEAFLLDLIGVDT